MKGVSDTITTVLLLLIIIFLISFLFIILLFLLRSSSEETEKATKVQITKFNTNLRVDNIACNNITIRNIGTSDLQLSEIEFFVYNTHIDATGPPILKSQEVGIYILNSTQLQIFPGTADLKIATPGISLEKREITSCPTTSGTGPYCGDGACNGQEACDLCTTDCGFCPATCGDNFCNGAETCGITDNAPECASDCGTCPNTCGNGFCTGAEVCSTCQADCGTCPPPPLLLSACQTISTSGLFELNQNVSSGGTCFIIAVDDVTLDCRGFLINYSQSVEGYGVYVNRNNSTVQNCKINQGSTSSSSTGVYINNPSFTFANHTIKNNVIDTKGSIASGIYFLQVQESKIFSNKISTSASDGDGVHLQQSSKNNVSNNSIRVSENSKGIYVIFIANDNIISENTINATGFASTGIDISSAERNIVTNNIFKASGTNALGIVIFSADNNTISNNTVYSNRSFAIEVQSSDNNVIYNNLLNGSSNPVSIIGTSSNKWNTTLTAGTNIIGGSNIGGNYYTNSTGNAFSQTCADTSPADDICDSSLTHATNNVDFLPLAVP